MIFFIMILTTIIKSIIISKKTGKEIELNNEQLQQEREERKAELQKIQKSKITSTLKEKAEKEKEEKEKEEKDKKERKEKRPNFIKAQEKIEQFFKKKDDNNKEKTTLKEGGQGEQTGQLVTSSDNSSPTATNKGFLAKVKENIYYLIFGVPTAFAAAGVSLWYLLKSDPYPVLIPNSNSKSKTKSTDPVPNSNSKSKTKSTDPVPNPNSNSKSKTKSTDPVPTPNSNSKSKKQKKIKRNRPVKKS